MALFKILIADDAKALRQALINLIGRLAPDWQVCGEAADGEEAIRKVAELQPNLVLVDLSLPILNGVQVVEKLRKNHPAVLTILISEQSEDAMRRLSQEAGVRAIPKSRLAADLAATLRALAAELEAPR